MKITKKHLKQIILEVLNEGAIDPQTGQPLDDSDAGGGAVAELPDVKMAVKYLPKVNNLKEYEEFITIVLQHAEQLGSKLNIKSPLKAVWPKFKALSIGKDIRE